MPLFWIILLALGGTAVVYAYAKATPVDRSKAPPPLRPDFNLNLDESRAITFAAYYEKDALNLRNFAQALLPDFPRSSEILLTKASQLPNPMGPTRPPIVEVLTPIRPGTRPGGIPGRISGHGRSRVTIGVIYDLDNYTDFASDVVSTTVDVLTHPADTVSGAWHIITHPGQSITDFANALVDALHAIPGMDEAGELLKDFSRTAIGEWTLRILATFGYYVMAPYLGAQLAAVSFALPGVAKAEPFVESWIKETIDRVVKTINLLLQLNVLQGVGAATSEEVNRILTQNPAVQKIAKQFTEEIGRASSVLTEKLGEEIARKLKEGAADALDSVRRKLADEYGYPPDFQKLATEAGNIREDNASAAYDLVAKTQFQTTTRWDPVTGEDVLAHLRKSRFQRVPGATAPGTQVYRDPRLLSAQEAAARQAQSIARLLYPASRKMWVEYYLNRQRYAEAGVKAKEQTGQSVAVSGPAHGGTGNTIGARPAAGGMLYPGNYLIEVETVRHMDPRYVVQVLQQYGVTSHLLQTPPGPTSRLVAQVLRPLKTASFLPGLKWRLMRKL